MFYLLTLSTEIAYLLKMFKKKTYIKDAFKYLDIIS